MLNPRHVVEKKKFNMTEKKRYKVLDLFCGCGGISEGFSLAGFKIIGGIDFNKDATLTFKHNFKNAKVYCTDIASITDKEVFDSYKDVDVIVGGPPCQGFSSANRWQKELEDPRNKLFFEYLRFVRILKPKVLMIENVRGILTRDNGYAKERITTLLTEMGYSVKMNVLNASEYGVPQTRHRAIIVGIYQEFKPIEFHFDKLEKKSKVSVYDAIGELYQFESTNPEQKKLIESPSSIYRTYLRRSDNVILDHDVIYPADKVQERISFVPQGGNWQDVPENLWPTNRSNRHSSAYKRLKEDDQSCTIDTGNAHSNYFHPLFNRIPSIRESARLQSFPDSFEFLGSRGSKYKQVGNAVPPLLAKAIAEQIKNILNENN